MSELNQNRIIIGLEAHDGTGKTETCIELLNIFGGKHYQVGEQLQKERSKYYSLQGNENFTEKCRLLNETYRKESELIKTFDEDFIAMDRTWASHAAERYYEASEECNPPLEPPYQDSDWPKEILKPNITFQIILDPDEIRQERVIQRANERGEKLSERDIKLNTDSNYRNVLIHARKKLGCQTFLIRERNPKTSALRVSQVLLGNMKCKPMNVNLDHLNQ